MSPIHLAERAADGALLFLPADERSNPYQHFGSLVEDHVHYLLRAQFGDRYQRLASDPTRKQADGIIWYEDGFIVVEIKARQTPRYWRFQTREDLRYANELRDRDIDKAVEQLQTTTIAVIEGKITPDFPFKPKIAASLIVVIEEMPLHVIAEPVLRQLLPPTERLEGLTRLMPQVIGLAELETLDEWQGTRLLDVLADKMQEPGASVESVKAYMQFREFPLRHSEIQNSLLGRIFGEFNDWIGGGEDVASAV